MTSEAVLPRGSPDVPLLYGEEPDERLSVRRILALAREAVGMELAFVGEFSEDRQVIRFADGEAHLAEDDSTELAQTYCQRVVAGQLPNAVPDTAADARVRDLPVTSEVGIGAYVGVPIRFSDGRVYGTLCCISREADPSLAERDIGFVRVLAQLVGEQLEREAAQRRARRLEIEAAGVDALLAALEARDEYTGDHSAQVVEWSRMVSGELGLAGEEAAHVEKVALLHDIGKIAIPDSILRKPGPLTDEEWEIIRRHPIAGETITASLPGLAPLARSIRAEHERWDGTGYPDGLHGEEIPIASRVVLVCDAYHAMRSDRPYRAAMSEEEALDELRRGAGSQFCPRTAEALIGLREEAGPATSDPVVRGSRVEVPR